MIYCSNCGNELNDEAKFCTKCGSPVQEQSKDNTSIGEEINKNEGITKILKGKMVAIIAAIVLIIVGVGSGVYFYTTKSKNVSYEKGIEIKGVNSESYPTVSVIIETKNFDGDIVSDDIAIKEGEAFPKNVTVEKSGEDNRYLVTYASPSDNIGKNLTVELEYINDAGDNIKCNTTYTAPELKTEKSSNNNVAVNTYDPNVDTIKDIYSGFIREFIYMVNNNNLSYIDNYVLVGSNIYNDFVTSVDSFKQQEISEKLEGYTIQEVKKINENTYELYVYESFYINYGKEHSSKIKTFNSIYTLQKSGETFKFTDLRYADK